MGTVPVVLTIAGSDSGGGAGIQADLKTFGALGVYGTSVITAITAQNTLGVTKIEAVTAGLVGAQIDAVVSDLGVDVVKTGMLFDASIVEEVVDRLRSYGLQRVVVDPVMVAKGGDILLNKDAVEAVCRLLLPLSLIVTPNAGEAEVLAGFPVRNINEARLAAETIGSMGPDYVLIKGGHFGEDASDVLYNGNCSVVLSAPRISSKSTHGTGCTLSSAIAAGLALGHSVEEAVRLAKAYVSTAIASAFPLGSGVGPLNHFHQWWR